MNPPVAFDRYREIWVVDFEFRAPDGHVPHVVCMAALEVRSGRRVVLWLNDGSVSCPSFLRQAQSDVLVVAFYASAEVGCFLQLGWPVPLNILDLYVENRCSLGGRPPAHGYGLVGAMLRHGIGPVNAVVKESTRELIMTKSSYTDEEQERIGDYCSSDVDATAQLLLAMAPSIDLPRALLRGRYMASVAKMEHDGIPVDTQTLRRIEECREQLRESLIKSVDPTGEIYDGTRFVRERFEAFLVRRDIFWPLHSSGCLKLDEDTFKEMSARQPDIGPVHELRKTLSVLKGFNLAVGPDGRNRTLLSPFGSKTGRNQPSTTKFIFGGPKWMRRLIQPEPSMGMAYIDFSQQEFGIAAKLSGDENMVNAYRSGDPYIEMGKLAGVIPDNATKKTHPYERSLMKMTILGTQYGSGEQGLAHRMGVSVLEARSLLQHHRSVFSKFWNWSQSLSNQAFLTGSLHTVYGWHLHVDDKSNPRSVMNWPMQATGAEILRLACMFCHDAGISICAPVHDALLVEAPLSDLDEAVSATRQAMQRAGEIVLGGFQIDTDAEVFRYPGRFPEERGKDMWNRILAFLAERA